MFRHKETQPPPQHAPAALLTPENCTSSSRIRAFLRLSRIATDDTIRQHLNETGPAKCSAYFRQKIVPQWTARAEAIAYCLRYAGHLRRETEEEKMSVGETYDLRVDPYALHDAHTRLDGKFSTCVAIENWVKNESGVESIIREQTVDVLNDKCFYQDWLLEFKRVSLQGTGALEPTT